jgi:hypothetical protein
MSRGELFANPAIELVDVPANEATQFLRVAVNLPSA